MDSLENYRILLAVADSGSFSSAAQKLGLTTTKVSRSIAETEQQIGQRLLQRTTRRVTVTDEGRAFIERIRPALAMLDSAATPANSKFSVEVNSLRVSCCRVGGAELVAPALMSFASAHPNACFSLDLHDRLVDPDNEGFDLALSVVEPDAIPDKGGKVLLRVELALVVSPEYVASHNRPRSTSELAQHRLLCWSGMRRWDLRGAAPLIPKPAFLANDLNILVSCCNAAQGVALVPAFMVRSQLEERSLLQLLDGFEPNPLKLYASWGRRDEPCPAAKAFLRHLESALTRRQP